MRLWKPRPPAPATAEPTLAADALPADTRPPDDHSASAPSLRHGTRPGADGFLFEEQVCTETVLTLLKRAYLDVEVSEHGWLVVRDDRGLRMVVLVDRERRLIVMQMRFTLRESAPWAAKLDFANRGNDGLVFVRFAVADATTLVCDHQLVFDGGVTPHAVVGALRRLMRVAGDWVLQPGDRDEVIAR